MSLSIERVKEILYSINQYTDAAYLPELDRFVYIGDDIEDMNLDDYDGPTLPLPSAYDINNYGMMEDFIERKTDGEAKQWLTNAIKGRGAFRNFRATCERFGLLNDWYRFEEGCYEDIAVYWCEQNGLEYHFTRPAAITEEEDDEPEEPVPEKKPSVKVVAIDEKNSYAITHMVAQFRVELAALKGRKEEADLEDADNEIKFYLSRQYPILAASISGKYIGYAVCRVDDDVVWLESIYVRKEYRRQGIASLLLETAEEIARQFGNDTLYIFIHPNNEAVINFLDKNEYNVLNLIEVRKKYKNEKTDTEYSIGNHKYNY